MKRRSFLSVLGASLAIPTALVKETNANTQGAEITIRGTPIKWVPPVAECDYKFENPCWIGYWITKNKMP